jgi:hypothetical protein
VLRRSGGVEVWFVCSLAERLLRLKVSLLSNDPERRGRRGAGRITVDAREKEGLQ